MIKHLALYAALTIFWVGSASAQDETYIPDQTPHFGFLTLKIGEDFWVAAACSVSGGDTVSALREIGSLLPFLGSAVVEAMEEVVLLDEGEVFCGLRHFKGPDPVSPLADTSGFGLTIRAYSDGDQIGNDLSPWYNCSDNFFAGVKRIGVCWEIGSERELDSQQADAVVACIDTELPGTGNRVSFLVYSGDVEQELADVFESEDQNVQPVGCDGRQF